MHPLPEHPPVDVRVVHRVVPVSDALRVELVQGLRHAAGRPGLPGVRRASDPEVPGAGEHLPLDRGQDDPVGAVEGGALVAGHVDAHHANVAAAAAAAAAGAEAVAQLQGLAPLRVRAAADAAQDRTGLESVYCTVSVLGPVNPP